MVDDIRKRREPLPALVGIYFITPTDENVKALVRDFSIKAMPQYRSAYVFFSGRVSKVQLEAIKECEPLVARLKCLREVGAQGQERVVCGGGPCDRSAVRGFRTGGER